MTTGKRKPDSEPAEQKNYITPDGLQRLKDEHRFLLTKERGSDAGRRMGGG